MHNTIRNIFLAVIALTVVSLSARNFSGAATTTSTAPARHYYLTKANFNGNQTLTACASGYHFASFAEILDPAVLTYNKTLGRSAADDGAGPPSYAYGWARTGYSSSSNPGDNSVPTNCNAWTSGATADDGAAAGFIPPFLQYLSTQGYLYVPQFETGNAACDNSQGYNLGVWCVEN
jgi:hypothetical protein